MGRLMAEELASGELGLDYRSAIALHLTSNHYPAVRASMVEPCIEAIEACNIDNHDAEIELPEGVLWQGQATAPAWAIVEGYHLDAWLEAFED